MILVTTAGKVGAEASRLLARQGTAVRVVVRDRARAVALTAVGVEVYVGDLSRPDDVDAALRGVSAVILVTPAVPDLELGVIDGATRAGVAHVVKVTSKASADSPIARRRDQARIEQGLIASELDYTLLRNNGYMQNFLMLAPLIAATSRFGSSAGTGRIGLIDSRDVAAVAAQIASSPAAHAGRTYWPTGPESLSYADVAAILSQVLGRAISLDPMTFEEEKRAMIGAGLPKPIAEMNAQAVGLIAEGDSDWVTDDVRAILGHPARSFAAFATDHAQAFS